MKLYNIFRYGRCIECGLIITTFLGSFEADSREEAIEQAIENWQNEQFGQGGALRDFEKAKEENFLDADFSAKEI